jgi:hypothetical protein
VHGEFSIGKTKIAFLDVLLTVGVTVAAVMIRKTIFGISGNPGLEGGSTMFAYCALDFLLAFVMALGFTGPFATKAMAEDSEFTPAVATDEEVNAVLNGADAKKVGYCYGFGYGTQTKNKRL